MLTKNANHFKTHHQFYLSKFYACVYQMITQTLWQKVLFLRHEKNNLLHNLQCVALHGNECASANKSGQQV
jgi:hypothetical protein